MSDDEEQIYKKRQKTIHYGTLDETDWVKQTLEEIQSDEEDYEPEKKKTALNSNAVTSVPSLNLPPSVTGNVQITSNEYSELEQEM